ncbi:peptide transporter ptr2 [Penicillium fimorum]|uniref:Peptide transporter ptr2 n=1 Tax=Penicillium fimorum TaxID=1882269 RepID=A0A9W9XWT4_9EURO|nr:peptide transporter ptr2 [Penicillium fimorum]
MKLGFIFNDTIQALNLISCADRPDHLKASVSRSSTSRYRSRVDFPVWVQTPSYLLPVFAKILESTTLCEYGYLKAPKDMRSLVQAMYDELNETRLMQPDSRDEMKETTARAYL